MTGSRKFTSCAQQRIYITTKPLGKASNSYYSRDSTLYFREEDVMKTGMVQQKSNGAKKNPLADITQ